MSTGQSTGSTGLSTSAEKAHNGDGADPVSSPPGILIYSGDGNILEANRQILELLGVHSVEAARRINLFTLENLGTDRLAQGLAKAARTGEPQLVREEDYETASDLSATWNIEACGLDNEAGSTQNGILIAREGDPPGTGSDHALEDEEKLARHFEDIPSGIAVVDREGSVRYVNEAFVTMFGYTRDEIPSLGRWFDLALPDPGSRRKARSVLTSLASNSHDSHQRHIRVKASDGSTKRVLFRASALGEEKRLIMCEDVSHMVPTSPGGSQEKYRNLIENLTDFVFMLDLDGNLLSINRTALEKFGYEPAEVVGHPIKEIIPVSVRKYVPESLEEIRKGQEAEGVSQYLAKDGTIHFLEYRTKRVKNPRGPDYIIGVARDVTERVATEKALKASEERFQILVESAHDGIISTDANGIIQFANPRMKEILKDPEPEGKSLREYFDEENSKILEQHRAERGTRESATSYITLMDAEQTPHQMVVSSTSYFDKDNSLKGTIGVFTDISELKRLEAQLQQSQKMEAIGTLAGGIAHDFNNILSGVLGYASLIQKHAGEDPQLRHYADMIHKSAERGAALAGHLLGFSRKGKQVVRDLDVHSLIDELVDILSRTLDRKVTLVTRKNARKSSVEGDPSQIQQVLMNLCINANDAMPHGGRLLITTDSVEIDEASCRQYEGLSPGTFLQIAVEDTGEGMSQDVKRRVFEPFFTTKEEGRGTGLGLSMVYGAVKSHGGLVKLYSEVGHGSTFIILLPVKTELIERPVRHDKKKAPAQAGTILIVDDEDVVRELLSEMLQHLGFHTIAARDGLEAVDIYRDQCNEIDLVFLDMIMPRLSGKETFLEMKRIRPDVRVILSTGFSRDGSVQEVLDQGILGFIQKPYSLDQLSASISEALQPIGPVD
jgi:two-component system cell cycle sensor histidine kinase/response regulator CckA